MATASSTSPLSTRITALAYSVRATDPELAAWLLAAQVREKQARRERKRKVRKVQLAGHGKGGAFWAPADVVAEKQG